MHLSFKISITKENSRAEMGATGSAKIRGGRKWVWPAQGAEKRPKAEGGEEVRGSVGRWSRSQITGNIRGFDDYLGDINLVGFTDTLLTCVLEKIFFFFEVDLKGPAANSEMSSLSQTVFVLTGQINSTGCPLLAHQAELALTETELERKESSLAERARTLLGPWLCHRRKKKNNK